MNRHTNNRLRQQLNSMNMSTMTSAIKQAIYKNNIGTKMVRQCQHDSAMKSFISVLQILKYSHSHCNRYDGGDNDIDNAIDTATTTDDDDEDSDNADACTVRSIQLKFSFTTRSVDTNNSDDNTRRTNQSLIIPDAVSSASSSETASSSASVFTTTSRKLKHFVFREPIVISPESIIPSSPSASSLVLFLTKFVMLSMYNSALTLHLHALSLASSTSTSTSKSNRNKNKQIKKLFLRSKKLYELVLEMHLEESEDVNDDGNDDDDENVQADSLFTLALTNNLGLIYRTMNDKVRSKICFETMFSTMMMYLVYSHSHNNEDLSPNQSIIIKDERIWNGLLSNAMDILFKHTYEISAAAA